MNLILSRLPSHPGTNLIKFIFTCVLFEELTGLTLFWFPWKATRGRACSGSAGRSEVLQKSLKKPGHFCALPSSPGASCSCWKGSSGTRTGSGGEWISEQVPPPFFPVSPLPSLCPHLKQNLRGPEKLDPKGSCIVFFLFPVMWEGFHACVRFHAPPAAGGSSSTDFLLREWTASDFQPLCHKNF